MIPAKIMQDYGRLDDESTMGVFDRNEQSLALGMATPVASGRASVDRAQHRASMLHVEKNQYRIFRKIKDRIKSKT